MATTVRQVLDRAREYIQTGADDELNRLNGAYTSGGTSLTLEFLMGGIERGAKLGIDIEEFHVWSISGQVATVQGAMNGSAAANHADDSIVRVNPTVSDYRLFRELNHELAALSSRDLVAVKQLSLTASATTTGYDMTGTTNVIDVRRIARQQAGTSKNWPNLRRHEWRFDAKADTTDFASGNSLLVYAPLDIGKKFRVWYDAPLTAVTAVTEDIETVTGLHDEAHDILSLGVALRVMAGLPIRRAALDRQGDPRRADEVSTGDVLNSPSRLKALYDQRIQDEIARLDDRFPRAS